MKTLHFITLFLLISIIGYAQVGINTTTPNAQLDIRSSSQLNPSNTDGILIPKIDTFPSSNPGVDQNGMLVFLTTSVGLNLPGFYYWDSSSNNWVKISSGSSPSGGTLNDAYNFGGSGQGKEIVAEFGPVTISGNDGILSTGSLGVGFTGLVGNGERLVWNPSRAAFRAGTVTLNQWEQLNLGLYSFSFGRNNYALGDYTGAWGDGNQVLGNFSTIWGEVNSSNFGSSHGTVFGRFNSFESGVNSVVWGQANIVNATNSTIFGRLNVINGNDQTVWGHSNAITDGQYNTIWGEENQTNASRVSIWGQNNQAQSNLSTIWGRDNNSDCIGCTVWGRFNNANSFSIPNYEDNTIFGRNNTIIYGNSSTSWGIGNHAESSASTVFGISNFARSMGETVLGIGATDYSPVGGTFNEGFDIDKGMDRLLVVGNAIDLNNNNLVDPNERRDALVILKNGNTGIGESFPEEKLHVVGKIRMVDGFEGAGKILVGDSNGTLNWQDNNSWGLTGNSGTDVLTNYIGTNDNADLIFKRNLFVSGIVGLNNTLFGLNQTTLSGIGQFNTVIGASALNLNANVSQNTVLGYGAMADHSGGDRNTAIGAIASSGSTGISESTSLGFNATVNGGLVNSTAIGSNSYVQSSNSMVLGSIAGINGALTSVNVGIGTVEPEERLHVVGNIKMVDGNQSLGRVLVSDNDGTASWQLTPGGAGLNEAYNFGGPGVGRTIIADAGAVTIAGTDGLVSTGALFVGALAPSSGTGVKMVWNPRKAAFRAGITLGTEWDNVNIGNFSTAFGASTTASGETSTAFGNFTSATGQISTAFGSNTTASGSRSTSFGAFSTALGNSSTAFGINNIARSFGETVIGIGATNYTPSTNGATQFRAANASDRLFVIGNAIDTNNDGIVQDSERSDAMVVLKNGNTGIGSSTPQDRLHVVGNIRMVDGNEATGRVMVSNASGTATWQTLNVTSLNGWSTTGNTGLSAATNFIGTTNGVDVIFRRNNIRAGRLGTNNTSFGVNALNPAVSGTFNTAMGSAALQNLTTGARNVAVGSVSLSANSSGNENTAVGVDALSFNDTGNNNTAVGRRAMGNTGAVSTGSNNTALGYFAYSTGDFSNSTALGANTIITASNQIRVGSNTVTSIGGTVGFTNLSDGRFKKNIQNDVPGLAFINKLKPVTYQLDLESMSRFLNIPEESRDRNAERFREYMLETGFIAQEVEQAAREIGFEFNGVDAPKGNGDYYGLRYASFVVPLVKAVQEQQTLIKNQQDEIVQLKAELNTMKSDILKRLELLEQK